MEVTLKKERPVLTVNIGDEQKKVPLTLNRSDYETIGKAEGMGEKGAAFFKKYIGDVYDEIGDDDVRALLEAWTEERKKLGMPGMGESSASPNS